MSSVDFLADLGSSAEARAVAKVLSAAAAPPWPHELRGYETARRAFENAGAVPVSASTSTSGSLPVKHSAGVQFRRLVGVKLVAVAGALTVTGVAVAAEADVLPSPIQRAAHQMLGGVGVPDPDQARTGQNMASSPGSPPAGSTPGHPGSQGSESAQGTQSTNRAPGDPSSSGSSVLPGTPSGTVDSSGTPTPSTSADVLTLCQTYVAHKDDGNGNGNGKDGLTAKDRKRLVALAGGKNKVEGYCEAVIAAAAGGPTVPQPTGASTTASGTSSDTASTTPSPSHDHKPAVTDPSSAMGFAPASTPPDDSVTGTGSPTPKPSRTGHKNVSLT